MRDRERVNSGLKRFPGAKPCVFPGKVASAVADVGSLFRRLRASICKSCRQKVHRTVARVRFHRKIDKKLPCKVHFWKMSSAKCAGDCSESSILHKNREKTDMLGADLDLRGRVRTAK